jgi:hypothetical protein
MALKLPQTHLHAMNIQKLRQEPLVDVRHLPNLLDTIAQMEGGSDGKDALIGGIRKLLVNVLDKFVLQEK